MKEQIIRKSTEMFLELGFKSVTMDHLSNEIGISKRTLYEYFSNKENLIHQVSHKLYEEISEGIEAIYSSKKNAIEKHFIIKDFILEYLKYENLGSMYQLSKYYPKIYDRLIIKQYTKMIECVTESIKTGIKEGLFRNTINEEIIARLYYSIMLNFKNVEIFDPKKFNSNVLHETFIEYHIRGICTEKGKLILDQLLTNDQV